MNKKTKMIISTIVGVGIVGGIAISPVIALIVILLSMGDIGISMIVYLFLNDIF
jgi:hypothetical protein